MPVYCKIPKIKLGTGVAAGCYVVFSVNAVRAAGIAAKLAKLAEVGQIPAHGTVQYKGEVVYYCLRGLENSPNTYTRDKRRENRGKSKSGYGSD